MANNDDLAQQVSSAGDMVDEPVWRLPLVRRYRGELDSETTDMKNIGGVNAGSITAGLFPEEFVAGIHLDIAGTAQSSQARR